MKTARIFSLFLLAGMLIAAPACKNNPSDGEDESTTEQADTSSIARTYTLTPFSESAQFADASIDKMTFKNGKFDFAIGGSTYKLGVQTPDAPQKMCANSAEGQHIHVIVDNNPYDAKYTSSFDYQIPDGDHYVLTFLSRSYHESIKTGKAYKAVKVKVAGNSFQTEEAVQGPMLFYSRPKGTYVGKENTDKVMLDFYLVNAPLGNDYKVKAEINAEQTLILDQWQPYYIEGLPMGDNKIKLTLIDKEGNPVDVPNNPVERVFTLSADPLEN
ncbi:MAG: phosphopeptide-binding protein [Saprospirales bacterium]|nr:phosphopeptide-binding protein [Saprospirales bacterium]